MAKDGNVIDSHSELSPVAGVTAADVVRPILVLDDGTVVTSGGGGGGGGGTSMTDDTAFTPGTTAVTPAAGTYRSVRDSLDDNDAGSVALTQIRGQLVTLETSGGTEIGTASNPIRVDPTGTTTQNVAVTSVVPGTGATNLGKAEDAPAVTGDTGVVMLAQRHDAYTSTVSANDDYSTLHVNQFGQLKTDVASTYDGSQLTAIYDPSTTLSAFVVASDPTPFDQGLVVRTVPNTSIDTPITGAVAVTSQVPGTGATNLGKAEDAAHTSGHTGVFVLGVQNNAGGSMVSADGDYSPFQMDSAGRLRATIDATKNEDSAHSTGDAGIPAWTVRTDGFFQFGSTDGDYVPFQTNAFGHLKNTTYGYNGLPLFTSSLLGTWDVAFTSLGDPNTLGIAEVAATAPTSATIGMAVRTIPSGRYSLTASSPTSVSVGVASGALVASNASRKGLIIRNLSSNTVSLNCAGGAAVLNSGITLSPGGEFQMGDYDFTTAAINAIASAAASTVAIQEYT